MEDVDLTVTAKSGSVFARHTARTDLLQQHNISIYGQIGAFAFRRLHKSRARPAAGRWMPLVPQLRGAHTRAASLSFFNAAPHIPRTLGVGLAARWSPKASRALLINFTMTPTGPDIGTSSHNRLSNRRAVGSAVRLREPLGPAWDSICAQKARASG